MFSGTVRDNLDPYHEIDDTELQAALESSGLAGIINNASNTSASGASTTISEVTELRTKQIGLDSPVTSGGDNLSQGQRQLLAFARALVRRSKLVILDEVRFLILEDLTVSGRHQSLGKLKAFDFLRFRCFPENRNLC